MNVRNARVGRFIGLAMAMGVLATGGCEGTDGDGDGGTGILGNLAEQCGLTCPAAGKGVAFGNASITGFGAIDSFFGAVVNFNTVSARVRADIDAELAGIQSVFQISDAELRAQANLGAAIRAKLQTQFRASVVVNAQPAKCSVDARVTAQATARCQASANCQADPGKASLQCMGTCTVDANVSGGCDANATVRCNVTAPDFECRGECSGTCTATLSAAAACSGTCNGTCSGTCVGNTATGGQCNGQCMGMCQGSCELTGMAALNCQGKCNGSCEYTPAMGSCDARAEVSCDLMASAMAECSGRCDGEFVPPKVQCDASASCEASAKAEAKFQVQCTPPSVEVKVVAPDGAMAQAQVELLIAELEARLPRLRAAMARADVVAQAGTELGAQGRQAVQGTLGAVANGGVDFIVGVKITRCAPDQLNESAMVIAAANAEIKKSTDNAASVSQVLGMM